MKRLLLAVCSCALLTALVAPPAFGAVPVRNGVRAGRVTPSVVGNTNFDNIAAPSLFSDTVRLYKLDGVSFKGGGAVLNSSGGFGVTGFSAPNFLAFNCNSATEDPGVPELPETINLGSNRTAVSLKIGSLASAGLIVKLTGKGSAGSESHQIGLTAALTTVTFTKPIKTIKVTSSTACVLVIDDLKYT